MKKTTRIVVAAVAVAALGTAGTLSYVGSSEAQNRGMHGPSAAKHMAMRGGHGRHGMGIARMMMVDQLFELADTNGDGTITRQELESAIGDRVSTYDENGDGTLDLEEFEGLFLEIVRPAMVRSFQFLDRDGSGTIAEEDIERPLGRMFDRLDRAGAGEISRENLRGGHRMQRRENRRGEWREPGSRRGDWRQRGGQRQAPDAPASNSDTDRQTEEN